MGGEAADLPGVRIMEGLSVGTWLPTRFHPRYQTHNNALEDTWRGRDTYHDEAVHGISAGETAVGSAVAGAYGHAAWR